MKINRHIFITLLLVGTIFAAHAESQENPHGVSVQTQTTDGANLEERVKRHFDATARGLYLPNDRLENEGAAIFPYLKFYQDDANPLVRSQVLWFLGKIVVADSLPLFSKALADNDVGVSADAARILYQFYPPTMFENDAEIGANLRRSVAAGNDSTATLLLLRYFPGAETVRTLEAVTKKNRRSVNSSFLGFPMVAPSLAANVSLSVLGSAGADEVLLSKIKNGAQNDLEFLLRSVDFISDKKILTGLFQKTIVDARVIQAAKDSAALSYRNRLARMEDLAVYVFTQKLKLESEIKIKENKRYQNHEISDAKQKISDALTHL